MANKWSSASILIIVCLLAININISLSTDTDKDIKDVLVADEVNPIHYPDPQCYNSELRIGKSTLATSDAYRDTENLQLIFPESIIEYIPHFEQDLCARASKVWIPYTCFKLHQPETWQLEEGYLNVKTLEREFTKKFYAVINGHSRYNYDAFFDFNVAFWVDSLDKYLTQLNDNSDTLTSYLGLKWYHNDLDKTFYSLIIQSPQSQRVVELVSFNKPDLSNYHRLRKDFKWKETTIPRASFKQYPEGEYPWTGYLGMTKKLGHDVLPDIVPIKISYGTSDIDDSIRFYTDVMEAELMELKVGVKDSLDGVSVDYAFVKPVASLIEIQYVQRPLEYTYGSFNTELYKQLISETHEDRISSTTCGIDRWFDNHYGYDTTKFIEDDPEYMDRVVANIINHDKKYRLYYVDHQRDTGQYDSDEGDYKYALDSNEDGEINVFYKYRMIIFDTDGQSIQMIGDFMNYFVEEQPPIYNKQWCATPCPHNQPMGIFNWRKLQDPLYVEDKTDVVYQIIYGEKADPSLITPSNDNKKGDSIISILSGGMLVIIICVAVVVISTIAYCVYKYCKCRCCWNQNGNISYGRMSSNHNPFGKDARPPTETMHLLSDERA